MKELEAGHIKDDPPYRKDDTSSNTIEEVPVYRMESKQSCQ